MSQVKPSSIRLWNKYDTSWLLTLFGTAIGAGVLFLPINAGIGGIWTLVFITVVSLPLVYLGHQGLMRFCLAGSKGEREQDTNINHVVGKFMGKKGAFLISLIYFSCIYPAVVTYTIAIVNIIIKILATKFGIHSIPRFFLSFSVVMILTLCVILGEKVVLRVCNILVYPLIASLFVISIALIPHWHLHAFHVALTPSLFLKSLLITLPVVVLTFNHSPIISSFSQAYKRCFKEQAEPLARRVCLRSTVVMFIFVMFFTFSSVLSISPEKLHQAKIQNVPVLAILSTDSYSSTLSILGGVISFLAVVSSFFGHFMGTREGLNALATKASRALFRREICARKINLVSTGLIVLSVAYCAYLNPSIMDLIGEIMAPGFAVLLFILPAYGLLKIPAMRIFRSPWYVYSFLLGVVTIIGFLVAKIF